MPNVYLGAKAKFEAGRRHFNPSKEEFRSSKIIGEIQKRQDFQTNARVGRMLRMRSLPANLSDEDYEAERNSNFGLGERRRRGTIDLQDERAFFKYIKSWNVERTVQQGNVTTTTQRDNGRNVSIWAIKQSPS